MLLITVYLELHLMFDAKDSIIYFSVFRSPDQNVHVRYCYHFSCQYKLNSFALSSKQARKTCTNYFFIFWHCSYIVYLCV